MRHRNRAGAEAAKVLAAAGVSALPVNVREIARKYAFVLTETLPNDVSGMLVPTDAGSKKPAIIAVNKRHKLPRQRFTIAHELGHLLMHRYTAPHADGVSRIKFRDSTSSLGTDREEIEANQFAAELLMPTELLVPRLRQVGLDGVDIDDSRETKIKIATLAEEIGVSELALQYRIANLFGPG